MRLAVAGILLVASLACGDESQPAGGDGVERDDGGPEADGAARADAGLDATPAGEDVGGEDRGEVGPGVVRDEGRRKPPLPQRNAAFGRSLAGEDVLVVGAPAASGCGAGVDPEPQAGCAFAGEAWVFDRLDAFPTRLKARHPGDRDVFGTAVAVSEDRVFVGAPREDGCPDRPSGDGCSDAGGVHVFTSSTSEWRLEAHLTAAGPLNEARFGSAVAASGRRLVVGAPGVDVCGATPCPGAGMVFVFERTDDGWVQTATLTDPSPHPGARFGGSIALHGDVLVVGAPDDPRCGARDEAGGCTQAGSVHVFTAEGPDWKHHSTIRAERPRAFELFGFAVDVAPDLIVVGIRNDARCADGGDGCDTSGAAELFEPQAERGWARTFVVKGSPVDRGDRWGSSVWASADRVLVGGPGEASCAADDPPDPDDNGCPGAGAVLEVSRDGSGWAVTGFRKAAVPITGHELGSAVSGRPEGVVGAPGDDSCRADEPAGSACVNSGRIEVLP